MGVEVRKQAGVLQDVNPHHGQSSSLGSLWKLIRSAGFLAVLLGSLGIAAAGFGLVAFLFLTRSYTPPSAHLVKDLYFDYSDSTAAAVASLVDIALPGSPVRPHNPCNEAYNSVDPMGKHGRECMACAGRAGTGVPQRPAHERVAGARGCGAT